MSRVFVALARVFSVAGVVSLAKLLSYKIKYVYVQLSVVTDVLRNEMGMHIFQQPIDSCRIDSSSIVTDWALPIQLYTGRGSVCSLLWQMV